MSYKINIVKTTNRCVVCGSLNISALIFCYFSQFKLPLPKYQKSLQLNFIILVLLLWFANQCPLPCGFGLRLIEFLLCNNPTLGSII